MKLRAVIKYKSDHALKSAGIYFVILLIVLAGVISIARVTASEGSDSYVTFSGYTVGAWIMMLVIGICSIREDLRFFIQNGVGRRTTFLAQWISALELAALLAIGGQVFQALATAITRNMANVKIGELYSMMYAKNAPSLTLWQHMETFFLYLGFLVMAYMAGMFFSLMFYKLNKVLQIVVAVALPLLFFGGMPFLWMHFSTPLTALWRFAASSSWNLLLVFLISTGALGIINGLMTRRIPIRGL